MRLRSIRPAVTPQNENHQITAVDMHRVDLDGEQLVTYEVVTGERINRAN